jgi:hypothetical protein
MKTYSETMNAISADEVYEGLLGYGMFSEKLPPVFTSEDFFDYCKLNNPTFKNKWCSYVQYASMRNINITREIGIPVPMAYSLLCLRIKENWDKIQKHFSDCTEGQKLNVSRIHIRKMSHSKSLFKMNYENWKIDGSPESDLLIESKYIVHADIAKCFQSIYSHSIPWALVGKSEAKSKKSDRKLWFNQLDHNIALCKNGETHGLLIGPHASNVLSEIILSVVDKELCKKWHYTRHIDDYTCYVDSMENAQLFLVDLKTELGKFDLLVNDKKTKIIELPTAMTKQWKRQLEHPQQFYRNGIFDYKSARAYFDNAIEIFHNNNNDAAILNYAIKSLPFKNMSQQAKLLCIKTIFHLCLLYPYLVQIVDKFAFARFKIDVSEIAKFSNTLFEQEMKVKNYDAVCFSLLFAIKYRFEIKSLSAQSAIDSDSCVYKLLAFVYFKKYGCESEVLLLVSHANDLKNIDEDFERNWLFVYEILEGKDLTGEWAKLKKQKISFLRTKYRL